MVTVYVTTGILSTYLPGITEEIGDKHGDSRLMGRGTNTKMDYDIKVCDDGICTLVQILWS